MGIFPVVTAVARISEVGYRQSGTGTTGNYTKKSGQNPYAE